MIRKEIRLKLQKILQDFLGKRLSLTEKLKSLLTNFSEMTLEDSKRLYEIGVVTRVNEKAEDMSPPSLSNSFRQKRSLPNRIHEFDIRPVYSECESYYWDEDVDEWADDDIWSEEITDQFHTAAVSKRLLN